MSGSEPQRSIEISRATADEAASIAAALHQAFAEYRSLYTAEAFAITTPTPTEIEQRWNEGPIWSVVKDGRLVGTVAAVAKGDALLHSQHGGRAQRERTRHRGNAFSGGREIRQSWRFPTHVSKHNAVSR